MTGILGIGESSFTCPHCGTTLPCFVHGAKDQRESKRRGKWRKEQDGHRGGQKRGEHDDRKQQFTMFDVVLDPTIKERWLCGKACGKNKELGEKEIEVPGEDVVVTDWNTEGAVNAAINGRESELL